jgi:hypothetical protein
MSEFTWFGFLTSNIDITREECYLMAGVRICKEKDDTMMTPAT